MLVLLLSTMKCMSTIQTAVLDREDVSPSKRITLLVRERLLRIIDIWFTELGGRPWSLTLNAENIDERMFSNGVVVDGQQVGGTWKGLISLVPDPAHSFVDPLSTVPTLALICDVRCATGEPYLEDSRSVLKRALAYLRESRPGLIWNVGVEVEFFLVGADGREASNTALRELLREVWELLASAGIAVDWFRIGPPDGLGRVQMRAADALRTADQIVLYKHIVRRAARRRGFSARFMAKPLPGPGTASMLVHHALWSDGQNRFFDARGWTQISALGRSFAGGLLLNAPALLSLCAPSVNSYRRLGRGAGPTTPMLSQTESSAACRVPAGTTGSSPASRRIKFCCGDPSANPYLALSAMLMAGLDGIENGVEVQPDSPLNVPMPHSLEEALCALKNHGEFLLKGGVFTPQLLAAWIAERQASQIDAIRPWPHPKELELDRED